MSDTLMSYDMPQTIPDNPESLLTEDELKEVDAYCKAINLSDSTAIMGYGSNIQKKLSELLGRLLSNLNSQDTEDIEEIINVATEYLRYITDEKNNFSFFKKAGEVSAREKYREAEKHVDKVADTLQQHQIQLMKDGALLAQMYYMNTVYFRDLNVKLAAGKRKLESCKQTELPALKKKAGETSLAQDAQAVADMKNQMNRFEKKIHELELTRTISLQSAPLIKFVRSNQMATAEKIQSTLLNTIPLWKKQVVLALGMGHTGQVGNEGSVEQATFDDTNKQLIENLNEVTRMQQEGKNSRNTVERELAKIDKKINPSIPVTDSI